MIKTCIKMIFAPEQQQEALLILRSIVVSTRTRFGCTGCSLYRNMESDSLLIYEDEWSNMMELEMHLRSKEYEKLLLVMEMALKAPEISFNTISRTAGIELIEKARITQ